MTLTLAYVYVDLCESTTTSSHSGARYSLSTIDDLLEDVMNVS